ncbi:MAG TPA: multicopper oxidase family protein [Steroidobacteraceae bacterium]|nr:multicopper oxidase family protein [Steroidobacteraceae bacterium]
MKKATPMNRLLPLVMVAAGLLLTAAAHAAAPGISGTTFNLTAQPAYISQPDGQMVYSWGYGCANTAGITFKPATTTTPGCGPMQIPGPTLIVTEGQTITVTLTNGLPTSAGNTSILFPGFQITSTTGGVTGLLTKEAAPGGTVSYTFTAGSPGTRAYYSGTQGDLQVEMGLYGAIIVLPKTIPTACTTGLAAANRTVETNFGESDFRLAAAAYDHAKSCYDREYLFQFSEMDPNIHNQALAQVTAKGNCGAGTPGCTLNVPTEPYHPAYFMINGRSMPDDMDPNYAFQYPHQPYNGNPHMHPGEQVLLRIVGQGRWQHPFHEHGNHVRILGRDGNLILSQSDPSITPTSTAGPSLAGPLLFTTTTTPGLAMDGIFYWTGRGLNWDAYAHNPASTDPLAKLPCTPDANGYNTGVAAQSQINYYEWCQDHNKPLQVAPFGDVTGGGPVTLPDPNLFTNGSWFGGSPYLGPNATVRATGPTGTTPPSGTIANPPTTEAGFAFMWHSHNEREITTNNIFPGGMMMMMLVDSREFVIDESN